MFDKKQKKLMIVTNDGLYNQKGLYKVKVFFIYPLLFGVFHIYRLAYFIKQSKNHQNGDLPIFMVGWSSDAYVIKDI